MVSCEVVGMSDFDVFDTALRDDFWIAAVLMANFSLAGRFSCAIALQPFIFS